MKDKPAQALTEAEALKLARIAAEHHFGGDCDDATSLSGGLSNFVCDVDTRQGAFIVRMSDGKGKLDHYLKEQWVSERARKIGIPTATIVYVGTDPIGVPYMVAEKIRGENASTHPERLKIVRAMGEMTARIHTIETHGYGRIFDWNDDQTTPLKNWTQFLDIDCDVARRLDFLERHKLLKPDQLRTLREVVGEMKAWTASPVLNHGDMRLKNVVVDKTGNLQAVIDWEDSLSCVPPYWDLSIALHDLNIDAKEAFIEGYGASGGALQTWAPFIKAFNILNYVPVVKGAAKDHDEEQLEHLRSRLRGDLDLYLFQTA